MGLSALTKVNDLSHAIVAIESAWGAGFLN